MKACNPMCTWRGKPRSYTFGQKKEKKSLEKEICVWKQKENKGRKEMKLDNRLCQIGR